MRCTSCSPAVVEQRFVFYEEKNPALANLLAEARLLYLELGLVRQSTAMAREIRWAAVVMAVFTFVTASAALFAFLTR